MNAQDLLSAFMIGMGLGWVFADISMRAKWTIFALCVALQTTLWVSA